jgi:hypothetical protein
VFEHNTCVEAVNLWLPIKVAVGIICYLRL